jgi:hypothetical protein
VLPDLGLSGLLKQAKGEVATPLENVETPRKRRTPRVKRVVDRSEALPRTVWLTNTTWERVRLQAIKKGMSASEVVELLLLAGIPDLEVKERAA